MFKKYKIWKLELENQFWRETRKSDKVTKKSAPGDHVVNLVMPASYEQVMF